MKKMYVDGLNSLFNTIGPEYVTEDIDIEYLPSNYTFNSEYQRQLARENALKRNANQKGANNRNAKTWRIRFIDGREIVIGGLQRWAVDNGYSASGIKKIAYKKWKRYRDIAEVTEIKVTHL
tara:strand:+ start:48 stop:413 length:366 start_codon:yes stop_codon:yes gene_type:complete